LRGLLPIDSGVVGLDLGCGDGGLLLLLRSLGYGAVKGVDRSVEQINRARERGLDCEVGNALDVLQTMENSLDLIVAFDLIEHLTKSELDRLLERAHAALRPGGTFLVKTPNGSSPLFGNVFYSDFTHETALTERSLSHILRLAGFRDPVFREAGPVPYGVRGSLRFLAWQFVRALMTAVEYVETGGGGSAVKTRVMIAAAKK
jgi:SAM-dependent methyltransferase